MKKERFCEILGDIDERHIESAGTGRNRRPWLVWSVAAALLCFVLVGALIASDPRDEPDGRSLLVVNAVEYTTSVDMDVRISSYSDLPTKEREQAQEAFETAIGLRYDDFVANIPDVFAVASFYSMDVPNSPMGAEYVPHDYVFACQTESGGEVRIAVCSMEAPLRDCIVVRDDSTEASEINGVEVVVYGFQDSSFMAQFSSENINYDIEADHITLEELETLLVGILAGAQA